MSILLGICSVFEVFGIALEHCSSGKRSACINSKLSRIWDIWTLSFGVVVRAQLVQLANCLVFGVFGPRALVYW